jgi:hypothetical protein
MGTFLFRANGLVLGGELFAFEGSTDVARSRRTLILGEGSFLLPNTGGQTTAGVQNFSYAGISLARGTAVAEGRRIGDYTKPESYETRLRLEIEGLDVFGLFSVQRLVLRLASSHPGPPARTADLSDDQIPIRVEECRVDGLVAAGAPVSLDLARAAEFAGPLSTHAAIVAEARKQRRPVAGRTVIDTLLIGGGKVPPSATAAGVSLRVGAGPGATAAYDEQHCTIVVPGLGVVHVGEVLSTKDSRRINLLRIEVDRALPAAPARAARTGKKKADGKELGSVLVGAAEINGSTFP